MGGVNYANRHLDTAAEIVELSSYAGTDVTGANVGSFADQANGKVIGQALIKEGYDVDQYDDGANGGSNIILTSVLKVMDANDSRVLTEIQNGSFYVNPVSRQSVPISAAAFGQTSNRFVLGTDVRFSIPGLCKIPALGAVFTDLYPFEVFIVVIAAVMLYILDHTRYGMHLRACGDNSHSADAAGIDVARVRTGAVTISGALSAVADMSYACSISAPIT